MEKKLFINFIDYYKDDVDQMLDIIKDAGFDGKERESAHHRTRYA